MLLNLHMDGSVNQQKQPLIHWNLYCFEAAIMIIVHCGAILKSFVRAGGQIYFRFLK